MREIKSRKIFFPIRRALFVSLVISVFGLLVFLGAVLRERFLIADALIYALKVTLALCALASPYSYPTRCSWVFLILSFPTVSIPAYLFFRRTSLSKKEELIIKNARAQKPKCEPFEKKMLLKCNENFTFLREIASYSNADVYTDTEAKYFSEAYEMLLSLIEDISKAKSFIFLEFYTVSSGEVFGKICDILTKKASEGVCVKILCDEVGSILKIPESFQKLMKKRGIEARIFSSLFSAFPNGANNRNHRKIAVIDGEVGYTGGVNLGDEYVFSRAGLGKWKDCGVRIEGEAVDSLTHTFLSDFLFCGGECENFSPYYKYKKKKAEGISLVFEDGPYPLYEEKISERMIVSLLDASEKSFVMTSPYLIFDSPILSAVRGAVRRGVRVKIVIPSAPDKLLTAILTRRYAKKLLGAGAEVLLYQPGFLHSKIYASDSRLLMLGTVNLDYRSLTHNFENGILFFDHPIIKEVKKDLENILSLSLIYEKKENPIVRLLGALLEIFAPLF